MVQKEVDANKIALQDIRTLRDGIGNKNCDPFPYDEDLYRVTKFFTFILLQPSYINYFAEEFRNRSTNNEINNLLDFRQQK